MEAPRALYIGSASPTPLSSFTVIKYGIPEGDGLSKVTIGVYDACGRSVVTLVDTDQGSGLYQVIWDGRDQEGMRVASGVYFTQIVWNGVIETQRMVVLR